MPRMRGTIATTMIRQLNYSGTIIGVTGNVLPTDVEDFMSCGVDAVMPKPFEFDLFRKTVVNATRTVRMCANTVIASGDSEITSIPIPSAETS